MTQAKAKSPTVMDSEANSFLVKMRSHQEESIDYLLRSIVQVLGVKNGYTSERVVEYLNGKTLCELVETSLLNQWLWFAEGSTIGLFNPELLQRRLQQMLSEYLEQRVVIGYGDVGIHGLNFSFNIPSLAVRLRPTLRIIKND